MIRKNANLAISIGILVIVATIIFIFSNTVIWIVDDINYQFNMAASSLERIDSVCDIFASQWKHYFSVNGRYVAHWFVQLYCGLLGQKAFAVSNALVYVAFILLLLRLSRRGIRDTWTLGTIALLLLFMYDTIYGPACQIGFVWTFAMTIGWLYVFFNSTTKTILSCVGLFLFSVIAGQGQEAINIGISGALIIYVITNRKTMLPCQWIMFFGFGIGALTLCLSPASIGRTDSLNAALYVTIFNIMTYLRVTYIFLIVLLVAKYSRHISLRIFYKENSFYVNAMAILLIFNLLIGVYGNRQLMGVEIMALILTIKLLPQNRFRGWSIVVMSVLIVGIYGLKWSMIRHCRNTYDDIVELYHESHDGVVYYDIIFPRNTWICYPSSTFSRLNDGVGTLKRLLLSEGNEKELRVYPACLKSLSGLENQVFEFDDGCFVVIQSKAEPAKFVLKREMNFGIYRRQFKDFVFSWDNPLVETEVYRANLIYEEVPFVDNVRVDILK